MPKKCLNLLNPEVILTTRYLNLHVWIKQWSAILVILMTFMAILFYLQQKTLLHTNHPCANIVTWSVITCFNASHFSLQHYTLDLEIKWKYSNTSTIFMIFGICNMYNYVFLARTLILIRMTYDLSTFKGQQ